LQQARRFVDRQGLGQQTRRFGRPDAIARVGLDQPALAEPQEEAAPGGKQARQRAPGKPLPVHLGDEAPNVMHLQTGQRGFARYGQQFFQVTPVIRDGVRRHPPLVRQLGQVGSQMGIGRRIGHSTLLVTRASAAETISPRRSR
jgi:hypothetical protein